jgi:malate dehydrogenase
MGVPVILGGKGIEKIVELALTDEEKAMLKKSADSVQAVVNVVKSST